MEKTELPRDAPPQFALLLPFRDLMELSSVMGEEEGGARGKGWVHLIPIFLQMVSTKLISHHFLPYHLPISISFLLQWLPNPQHSLAPPSVCMRCFQSISISVETEIRKLILLLYLLLFYFWIWDHTKNT